METAVAWFSRWLARRQWPTWSTTQSAADFTTIFGGDLITAAGVTLTADVALNVPAVYSSIQVLAQDVARATLKLRRKIAEDTYVDAVEHPLYEILASLANPETTSYTLKLQMMMDLLVHEHAFAQIVRQDGRVAALWRLDPTRMTVDRDDARRKRWRYGSTTWLFDASMPPILELSHPSPVRQCRDVIATAAALQQYVGRFFANGARPDGILQASGAITDDTAQRLQERWIAGYGRSGSNRRGVAVIDGSLKFEPIASQNDDAQLIETMRALNTQIAGAFRVPPWKIGDLNNANYSNMESGELAYITGTLDPYFECWESAVRRDLLTSRQYGAYTVTFDRSALVRNDVKSLHESLAVGRNTGIYSVNDCRRKLGENPIGPEGDEYLVNSALQPVGAPNEPTIA
jgi:HK97 family phage portal protein